MFLNDFTKIGIEMMALISVLYLEKYHYIEIVKDEEKYALELMVRA